MVRMRDARPLPVPFQYAPFRVRDALARDIPAGRLRRRDLESPVHGVRARAGSTVSRIDAIAVVLRPDQHFSHTSAASIWGAPLPSAARNGPVHVTSASDNAMRRTGVVGHRSASTDVRLHCGKRVSAPAQMWFECASLLELADLVVIGDHLVGRSGLATIDELAEAIRAGARASRMARAALELIRVGAESAMETRVRLAVVDAGFPEPQLNIDVLDGAGKFLGRVDMAWPEYRIALEYDGDHHRERETFHHDQRRRNGFEVNGWLVIHVTAADAARPAVMFERLRQAFALRVGRTRGQSTADRAVRAGLERRT
ncbi:hypothetical protein BJK06_10335 [Curtobacterium sp. BH-2-1-1]|nr:hypothetical protein BJK06_10335 [Curtobacterium sp. BH-2-1-1]